jgi:hypothetical protein
MWWFCFPASILFLLKPDEAHVASNGTKSVIAIEMGIYFWDIFSAMGADHLPVEGRVDASACGRELEFGGIMDGSICPHRPPMGHFPVPNWTKVMTADESEGWVCVAGFLAEFFAFSPKFEIVAFNFSIHRAHTIRVLFR